MNNFSKQILIGLAALAAVAYLGLQLSLNIGTMIDIDYATYATANDDITTDAYFFREETVLTSQYRGTNTYFYSDGEKVALGSDVVAVYASSSAASLQAKINSLNRKIKLLEMSSVTKTYSTSDISRMDETISDDILSILKAVDDGSIYNATLGETDLLITLNRRRSVLGVTVSYDMQIDSYKAQKQQLEARLSGSSAIQKAPVSGIFYSTVDGYENIFTKKTVDTMTMEDYYALSSATPDQSLLGGATGKLVTSSKWYISVCLDKREAARLTDGKSSSYKYKVSFPYSGDRTVAMKLERKISQTDFDTVVLIFSSGEAIEGFNFTRAQPVNITRETYTGLRIPVSALRIVDGQKGVYALDGNVVIFKTAEPLYEDNGYYICALPDRTKPDTRDAKKLSLHDVVVTTSKGIEVGKIVS